MTLLDLTPRTSAPGRLATLPVVVVGAGPVGLAAAAHLHERGLDFVILEAGATAAASVRAWGHTRLFTPWRHLIDPAAQRILASSARTEASAPWSTPEDERMPTGAELVDLYLDSLARSAALAPHLQLETEVLAITREGMDRTRTRGRAAAPLIVRVRRADGSIDEVAARAVIDASGTYRTPNPLSANGLALRGAETIGDRLLPALPDVLGADRARFAGRHTTVVGAGHSAAGTLLALTELARTEPGTRATWITRTVSADRITASDDDELPARAALGGRLAQAVGDGVIERLEGFAILEARCADGQVELVGVRRGEVVTHRTDLVVAATGFRPDLTMLRELRLDLDDIVEAPRRLAPLIDPNVHSCGTVEPHGIAELRQPEPGFFVVGMKSYGRAPTFLLATGYEQVRSIVAELAGDTVAARRIELSLPATGVCSTDGSGGACCS